MKNNNFYGRQVSYINHKYEGTVIRIPVYGPQKITRVPAISSSGLIRAALCLLPLAGAAFAAWITLG
jgi:hypothetical protein